MMQIPKDGMLKLRLLRGNKCAVTECDRVCDEYGNDDLHFAHIRHTPILDQPQSWRRGQGNRYYDILRHPMDYILLCNIHHRQFDKGKLDISKYPLFPIAGKIMGLSIMIVPFISQSRPKELEKFS